MMLRAKVVVQDQSNTGAVRADISGNTICECTCGTCESERKRENDLTSIDLQ